jgi:hypothetical protein
MGAVVMGAVVVGAVDRAPSTAVHPSAAAPVHRGAARSQPRGIPSPLNRPEPPVDPLSASAASTIAAAVYVVRSACGNVASSGKTIPVQYEPLPRAEQFTGLAVHAQPVEG